LAFEFLATDQKAIFADTIAPLGVRRAAVSGILALPAATGNNRDRSTALAAEQQTGEQVRRCGRAATALPFSHSIEILDQL
jgi:hypothetical protein